MYRVTRCAVGTRLVTVGRGEAGWEDRREGVNDMYTQTGRTGRKEGKIPRKTKPSRGGAEGRERIAEGTRLWDVLVPLTILNHPVYSPLVFPSSTPRRAGRLRSPTSRALPLPPSLFSRVSLFCSSRTHRCGTSIVLKWFHLIAPLPQARYSLHGILDGRNMRVFEFFFLFFFTLKSCG